ncbi:MAG: hypothetical protein ACLFR8_08655 [Alkalispirochaeta sp.]
MAGVATEGAAMIAARWSEAAVIVEDATVSHAATNRRNRRQGAT